MSRDDGFDVADVATGHLDDPKVKALWRELAPDQARMSRALMLHFATLLASWRQGCRVTVDEAVPVWLAPDAELVTALVAVRLLDRTRRIPARSWKGWFGPAWERREARRESGRLGGLRARGKRSLADALHTLDSGANSGATATPHLTGRPSGRPSVPSDRPSVNARETVQGTNGRRDVPLAELSTPPLGYVASKVKP